MKEGKSRVLEESKIGERKHSGREREGWKRKRVREGREV
jgi:hypothetical protein